MGKEFTLNFEFTIDARLARGLIALFSDVMSGANRPEFGGAERFMKLPAVIASATVCAEGFKFLGIDQQSYHDLVHEDPKVNRVLEERRRIAESQTQNQRNESFRRAMQVVEKMKMKIAAQKYDKDANVTVVVSCKEAGPVAGRCGASGPR